MPAGVKVRTRALLGETRLLVTAISPASDGGGPVALHQLELLGILAQQLAHRAAELEHLAAVAAVLERVPVTDRRSAAGGAAVHPAAVLTRYRRRPAEGP
jgi:hypothetical protein